MFRISCFRALGLNASKGISPLFNASTPLLRQSIAPESSRLTSFFASSSPFRCYASSASKLSPPKATPPPPPRPAPVRTQPPKPAQAYSPLQAFNKAIVDAGGSAVLYVAPRHTMYRVTSYMMGVLCFIWASILAMNATIDSDVLTTLPRILCGVICLAVIYMTWFFFSGIRGLVSKITAYAAPIAAAGTTSTTGPILQVNVRSMFPFVKDRIIRATPDRIAFPPNTFRPTPRNAHDWEVHHAMVRELEHQERIRNTPFWKAPATKASFAAWSLFTTTKHAFTKEMMVPLYVSHEDGGREKFKFDTQGKFAEESKHLARVLKDNY